MFFKCKFKKTLSEYNSVKEQMFFEMGFIGSYDLTKSLNLKHLLRLNSSFQRELCLKEDGRIIFIDEKV